MIQGYSKYVPIITSFEKYADSLVDKLLKIFGGSIIDIKTLGRDDLRDIESFLNQYNWETKANRTVWKSVKINDAITYDEYIETIGKSREVLELETKSVGNGKRKIGAVVVVPVLASISSNRTAKTLHLSVKKSQLILQGRVDRLDKSLVSITSDTITKNMYDIERIVGTLSTQSTKTTKYISRLHKRLKGSSYTQRLAINKQIATANRELAVIKASQRELTKALSSFKSGRSRYTAQQEIAEYKKLVGLIRTDISTNQQRLAVSQSMRAQASRVASTAQTEMAEAAKRANNKKLQKLTHKGKKVRITISLSPAHDIIDICDDLHGEYTAETLPAEGLPPYHRNCQCDAKIEKF